MAETVLLDVGPDALDPPPEAAPVPAKRKGRTIEAACPECGTCFEVAIPKKDRSPADHRRFFALIAAAFKHWPEQYAEHQPESEEHLRAWLLCKASQHHEVEFISLGIDHVLAELKGRQRELVQMIIESAVRRSVEAAMRKSGKFAFGKAVVGDRMAIYRPRSIDWHTIDQAEFNRIRDAVEIMIEEIIGVPANQLLAEVRNEA